MEFLQEVLRSVRKIDDAPTDEVDADDQDTDIDDLLDDPDAASEPDSTSDAELNDIDDSDLMGDDPTEDPMAGFKDPDQGGSSGGSEDIGTDNTDDSEIDPSATSELDDVASNSTDDPDKQGTIRNVPKAHLVYKRGDTDGGFEELWIYNIGTMKDELDTRKAILADTDIPLGKTSSPDGEQSYTIWSSGNAEMLHIKGLPN